MSHEAPTPSSNEHAYTIQGEATTVTIVNPDYIEKKLQTQGKYIELLRKTDDDLPIPCREATIAYEHDEYSDEFYLNGHISFNPPENNSEQGWNTTLLNHIKGSLETQGATTISLPYHHSTLYAQLDDTYAVQISAGEATHEHTINMRIERLKEIYHELEQDYDPVVAEDTARFTLLRDFVAHWNTVLSSITKLYGKPGEKAVITMQLPEDIDTSAPSKELVKSSIPEQEQTSTEVSTLRTLDDIGGATAAKEILQFNALTFKHPELARQYGVHPSGFLLHGPAGTGKSSLAEAFANEIGAEVREISSTDIVTKWVGKSGKNASDVFEAAKMVTHPLVLFFDEFDSLAPKGASGTAEREDVKNVFKRELTAIAESHPNIIVVAATNKDPGEFDEALIRAGRLLPIYVPIPNEQERTEIWGVVLWRSISELDVMYNGAEGILSSATIETTSEQFQPYASDINPAELARHTEDMTGADITEILHTARTKKFTEAALSGTPTPISHNDILSVIRSYRKP